MKNGTATPAVTFWLCWAGLYNDWLSTSHLEIQLITGAYWKFVLAAFWMGMIASDLVPGIFCFDFFGMLNKCHRINIKNGTGYAKKWEVCSNPMNREILLLEVP